MSVFTRLRYLRRVLASYCLPGRSQLSFWHETPAIDPDWNPAEIGPYPMTFAAKADYAGPFDAQGVPLLDYRGAIGPQYNPIAVAQFGLGNFNLSEKFGDPDRRAKFLLASEWLAGRLEANPAGLSVWNHTFDWEYRSTLKAPWYSGLAQGQGISLLLRAHLRTGEPRYLGAARRAFEPFTRATTDGGVVCVDGRGRTWIEEYIVAPPTHILNGFLWALWGVRDYHQATGEPGAKKLWDDSLATLREALPTYDAGFWSLYEHSGTRMRMLASPFYHDLHITQLRVMHRITGETFFAETADRWEKYRAGFLKRTRAKIHKAVFKVCYY